MAGLSNEVSGGALSLSMREASAELAASTPAMQLVMTLSKLMFGAFMLLGGLLGDTYGRLSWRRWEASASSSSRRR
jgi:MFS family permease